jgi:hypothetical protein
MLRKHGTSRVSDANIAREIAMPIVKLLPHARSHRHIRADPDQLLECLGLIPFPRPAQRRRTIWAAVSRLVTATATFTAYVGHAFLDVSIGFLSWLIAEFLAGCAAYGQATYPAFLPVEDHVERGHPVPPTGSPSTSSKTWGAHR